jgi:aspartate kinase
MPLLVQKFGGSSVADVDKIRHAARLMTKAYEEEGQLVVVVSAMGKSTDGLVAMARQITDIPCGREYDMLLATGEMVSAALTAMILQSMGYKAIALNGQQAGIRTEDGLYNQARIEDIDPQPVQALLDQGYIVVVTGFQGVNTKAEFITLGRGGSDTTAVSLAGALKAYRCDIYTDVPGVFSTDPRMCPDAVRLNEIAHIEMMELARLGAKVLHPRSVEAARRYGVPVRVCSTFEPEDPGTMILDEQALNNDRRVTGIACDKNQARIALAGVPDKPGVAADLFARLADEAISVDMIIQSIGPDGLTNDIAFTINSTDLPRARVAMETIRKELEAKEVLVDEDIAKVSIVGVGMIDRPGIAADMFRALSGVGINIKMIATSEIKISCLVDKSRSEEAVREVHNRFFDPSEAFALLNEKVGY